jgi:DeoR/GlpR family transcriptional regulator of sugar metabolism
VPTADRRERRQLVIRNLIETENEIGLTDLASRLNVSEMTIRRDLEALEEQGVLRRVLGGGAIAVASKAQEPDLVARALEKSESKVHIAGVVVDQLRAGEAVYLDGGSTALAVARALKGRDLRLTVVTRSLVAALELGDEPTTHVVLLGGAVKGTEMMTLNTATRDELSEYNVDTYVMGIGGVDAERGLTDYDPQESVGKRLALRHADRTILAFDRTKLGRVLFARVASLNEVDVVVTDIELDDRLTTALARADIFTVAGTGAVNHASPNADIRELIE